MAQTKTGPWKERQFLDLWSVVHFFSCFTIGCVFLLLNIDPYIASAIAVGLFAGWEIIELLTKIHEQAANRVSDVIVDYAGFFLAQLYVFALHKTMHWYIPATTALIAISLEIWGLVDFLQRKKNKKA
jgi:hypothetical protein